MELKEDNMETLRKYAKEKLEIERSEDENVLVREINDLLFAIKEKSGNKIVVEALAEFLEKKIEIFHGRFNKIKTQLSAASNALLGKRRSMPVTEYDRATNTLANLPVGNQFKEFDKRRNDEFLVNLHNLDRNIKELKNEKELDEPKNHVELKENSKLSNKKRNKKDKK